MDNVNYLIMNPLRDDLLIQQNNSNIDEIRKKFYNKIEEIKNIIKYLSYLDELLKNE